MSSIIIVFIDNYLNTINNRCVFYRFRWVACQLDLLSKLPTDRAKREALSKLPPTLFETYERILERVNESGPEIQVLVQRTMCWIFHGGYGLSTEALCEAICINGGEECLDRESICDKEDILMHCSSLIRLSSYGEFEPAHFTVKEFLTQIASSPNALLKMYSLEDCRALPYLAKTCLTYMSLGDFRRGMIEGHEDWKAQQKQYPFCKHATRYWVEYAKDTWADGNLQDYTRTFFDPASRTDGFLSWARLCLRVLQSFSRCTGRSSRRF